MTESVYLHRNKATRQFLAWAVTGGRRIEVAQVMLGGYEGAPDSVVTDTSGTQYAVAPWSSRAAALLKASRT